MEIKHLLVGLTLVFFSTALIAQSDQAIGDWKSYQPYTKGVFVTQSPTSIYYAADFSLIEINKEDNTVSRLSKTNGLSDVGISIVKYSEGAQTLIIAYANGNIDLIKDGQTITLPFIKQGNILGDREIYNINVVAPDRVFISTGFGVLELNPVSETFTNDIRTGIAVYSVARHDGYLYAATEEGIYRVADSPGVNLQDFVTNWSLMGMNEGFPGDYSSKTLEVFKDDLYLNINDSLFTYRNGELNQIYFNNAFSPTYFSANENYLLAGMDCRACLDRILVFDENSQLVNTLSGDCIVTTTFAIIDEAGAVWLADLEKEFRKFDNINGDGCSKEIFDGPETGFAWELDYESGSLWVATGGWNNQFTYLYRSEGFLRYHENEWTSFNRRNRLEMNGMNTDPNFRDDDIFDVVAIKGDPSQNRVYIGSWAEGFLDYDLDADDITIYNQSNSSLGGAVGDAQRTRIGGIDLDQNGNVWVSNYLAEEPLSVFNKSERSWKSFEFRDCGNFTQFLDLVVDGNGNKWMVVNDGGAGVMVFNEGDLNDPNDDQCRLITQNNSNLPINDVNSLAVDLDGDVWVGTQDGVVIFQCGSQAFDAFICPGFLQIVNVGGDNEYLLKGENVQCIAVDGANRKWFGTTNGIFLQSPSGDELLASYNELNSPLFDNNVMDIAINQQTGEVFVATPAGIQSFRTDATAGGALNSTNVKVFPNPVRPDYDGPIAISGLARDANVKITDISGKLVYETDANGGEAIWDGKDYNGRKVETGVYLVFSTTSRLLDNPDAVAAKILFVK
ncbi:MAG: hypothetical protein KDC24_06895 [Saprospiraceae bacterium]|nr:hypothetical protein [Saprospiraceae bacterium]